MTKARKKEWFLVLVTFFRDARLLRVENEATGSAAKQVV